MKFILLALVMIIVTYASIYIMAGLVYITAVIINKISYYISNSKE